MLISPVNIFYELINMQNLYLNLFVHQIVPDTNLYPMNSSS